GIHSVDFGSQNLKTWDDIVKMMAEKYPESKLQEIQKFLLAQKQILPESTTNESEMKNLAENFFQEVDNYVRINDDNSLRTMLFPNNSEFVTKSAISNPLDLQEQMNHYQLIITRIAEALYAVGGL